MERTAVCSCGQLSVTVSGDPEMHRDICLTNREPILRWLEAFGAELSDLAREIREGGEGLETTFREAKETRDGWLRLREGRRSGA